MPSTQQNRFQPSSQSPADHETASPESGDRAQPTNTGVKNVHHASADAKSIDVPPPADHETASPESGDRAMPTR